MPPKKELFGSPRSPRLHTKSQDQKLARYRVLGFVLCYIVGGGGRGFSTKVVLGNSSDTYFSLPRNFVTSIIHAKILVLL